MLNIPRRLRRRLILLVIILLLVSNLWYIVLPPESAVRLAVSFNGARLFNFIRGATIDRDAWLWQPAQYPIDLSKDVGYLIKTGYGTRSRVPAQLEAFARTGDILGQDGKGFLVVGDWTASDKNLHYEVHDAIKMVMETKMSKAFEEHPRFVKYQNLQKAIKSGDEEKAALIGKEYGWELDALKFIMGMELAYDQMPNKKWYIILDDDTFLIPPSFEMFLSHLNPKEPQYIGNAVGDYKGRFAHGGSAVLLSGEAMTQLFERPSIVAEAYMESLDETWGDKLVATTLQKLGIYLDERYSHHFNGEPPEFTRIASDRFCAPLISFHGLREQGAMSGVADTLSKIRDPVLWGQLVRLFRGHPLQDVVAEPVHQGYDYVGPRDENTRTWERVKTADACLHKCEGASRWCMAWTHDGEKQECYGSPWVVMGLEKTVANIASGVNGPKVEPLLRWCS